jgi:hypothetical protein
MRITSLAFCLLVLGCVASRPDGVATELRGIIGEQAARHPRMGPEDLYKLLHQAAMGSEHAMTDSAGIRGWMENELRTMGEGTAEPMVDTIAPGGRVVRVHLRPWVAAGRSTDSLLHAFIATARVVPQDTLTLARFLRVADSMVIEGKLPFAVDPWRALVAEARADGFAARHHSAGYETAYHPAYRVVAGSLVP